MVQRMIALTPRHVRTGSRVRAHLAALLGRSEPIDLVEQRFNFLPRRFRWRGDLRRVRAVARVWERPRGALRPPRRYFEVICGQGGRFILFQDLHVGTWHVSM